MDGQIDRQMCEDRGRLRASTEEIMAEAHCLTNGGMEIQPRDDYECSERQGKEGV